MNLLEYFNRFSEVLIALFGTLIAGLLTTLISIKLSNKNREYELQK